MKKVSTTTQDLILRCLDSVFSIAVLPFAVYLLFEADGDAVKNRMFATGLFLSFCISMICQALRKRLRSENYIWQLVQAGIYLISTILIVVIPSSTVSMPIITFMLAVVLILNRVRAIIKKHKYRTIMFNAACIILIVAAAVQEEAFAFVMTYMLVVNMGHIASLSFSGMDMKIMMKVIRKTYAADILSGLILLMAAFSFMFPVLEENITTFKDALWYCFAVVTTIGFGDFAAVTTLGRVMSALLGAYGIVVVALITSVVVNFYSEVKTLPEEDGDEDEDD